MADEEMDESMDEAMDETMEETIEESEEMAEMGEESMSPAWFTAELVDVNTGAIFSIADYKGKVVLVETMAIWCSTCLRQQQHLQSLHSSLADAEDDLVSITLDVDPNEDAGMLERYTDRNGFDWIYAVAPAAVSRELADLYGNLFLNPPSAPILVIDRHGEAHPLPFGLKDVGTLMEHLSPFLAEGM
jgi:thiol-disulfide isomerase/thioredoxin